MPTFQLIYSSRRGRSSAGAPWPMHEILVTSRANNRRDAITGFLISDDNWFLQILEGEEAAVRAAYARIGKDPRHTTIRSLVERPIRARSFPEWAMGGVERSREHEAMWARHGAAGTLDPSRMTAVQILGLAMELSDVSRAARLKRVAG